MIAYNFTENGVTVFIHGRPVRISNDSPKYEELLNAFDDGLDGEALEEVIEEIVTREEEEMVQAGFDAAGQTYEGHILPTFLIKRIEQLKDQGIPTQTLVPFFKNFSENPSFELATLENLNNDKFGLYDFLSVKDLPITTDGHFIAYRGVGSDLWSKNGNPETRVIQGKVNEAGRIYNELGATIEVHRADVNPSRAACAAQGLHVGSLSYAKSWGQRVIVCKVNPKDVVSVPSSENSKCRVCKYEIIGEFKEEYKSPVVEVKEEVISISGNTPKDSEWQAFKDRIAAYLDNKSFEGVKKVPIKSIQNSFSPEYPNKVKTLAALREIAEVFDDYYVFLF